MADPVMTRRLLAELVTLPADELAAGWAGPVRHVTGRIAAYIAADDRSGAPAVPFDVMCGWRAELDVALLETERADAALWSLWRRPGTWLDGVLRFRSILAHVAGKAYWDQLTEVRYAD